MAAEHMGDQKPEHLVEPRPPHALGVASAVRLAGELNTKPLEGATLDELAERIKVQLAKLGPIIELDVLPEPEGSKAEAGLTAGQNHGVRPAFRGLSRPRAVCSSQ
jgi:hypothetical protein